MVDDGAGKVSDEEALAVGDLAMTFQFRFARHLQSQIDIHDVIEIVAGNFTCEK